ncbi:MAG TPA: hypothetical protein VF641_05695 [Methylobacterium sp.]
MPQLAHIPIVVLDYDEARLLRRQVGVRAGEDTYQPEQGKRWIVIRPPRAPDGGTTILLARAATERQSGAIGDQAGGRVFLFLATDDFERDHAAFTPAGSEWLRPPTVEALARSPCSAACTATCGTSCSSCPGSTRQRLDDPLGDNDRLQARAGART